MKCPKCNGKAYVKESIHDAEYNVTYRRYECKECEKIFCTSEMQDSRKLFTETYKNAKKERKEMRENK